MYIMKRKFPISSKEQRRQILMKRVQDMNNLKFREFHVLLFSKTELRPATESRSGVEITDEELNEKVGDILEKNMGKEKDLDKQQFQIGDYNITFSVGYMTSKTMKLINTLNLEQKLEYVDEKIENDINQYTNNGSWYTLEMEIESYIEIDPYTPLTGSSYLPLPKEMKNKRCVINVKNNDNEYFRWCHCAHVFKQDMHPERVSKYKHVWKNLNYDGIEFPVSLDQVEKIEDQNDINISVYSYDEKTKRKYPLYLSCGEKDYSDKMHLLYLKSGEKSHFVLIKKPFTFLSPSDNHKHYLCEWCLSHFTSENRFETHRKICKEVTKVGQELVLPLKKEYKFGSLFKSLSLPFYVVADFEALTRKTDTCLPNPNKSSTVELQIQEICSFGCKLICAYDDSYSKPYESYRGKDANTKFLEKMLEYNRYTIDTFEKHFKKELNMTENDEKEFQKSTECHICKRKFNVRLPFGNRWVHDFYCSKELDVKFNTKKKCCVCGKNFRPKVRDHCHVTGKYRGAAHQDCNLQFQLKRKLPVLFHNLRGYDSHFIIQAIGKFDQEKMSVIPLNFEKFISIQFGNVTFLDSMSFLAWKFGEKSGKLQISERNFRKRGNS